MLKFHDFPGLESKWSNSMTFQVFQDRYEPCQNKIKCVSYSVLSYTQALVIEQITTHISPQMIYLFLAKNEQSQAPQDASN